MREFQFDSFNKSILNQKKTVNEQIARSLNSPNRKKTTRTRSKGERDALDQISVSRWKKAVANGKVKKIKDRVWYYDYED